MNKKNEIGNLKFKCAVISAPLNHRYEVLVV